MISDKEVTYVLYDLGDWIEEKNLSGERTSAGDHSDRIDDWYGIKESLHKNFPNGGDITKFDIDGAKKERNAEREKIKLENNKWN